MPRPPRIDDTRGTERPRIPGADRQQLAPLHPPKQAARHCSHATREGQHPYSSHPGVYKRARLRPSERRAGRRHRLSAARVHWPPYSKLQNRLHECFVANWCGAPRGGAHNLWGRKCRVCLRSEQRGRLVATSAYGGRHISAGDCGALAVDDTMDRRGCDSADSSLRASAYASTSGARTTETPPGLPQPSEEGP